MNEESTYIRFDWAMKNILRDKANFGILEGFLSVLLREEIKIVELLESESNQEDGKDKFNRVDIKAKNSKGHIIIIEVQLTRQLYYLERILYGVCKTITEHIHVGENYDKVKKVYSISLLYCDYGQGDDYIYHGDTRFKGLHTGTDLIVNTKEEGVIVPHLPREVFPEYYLVRVNHYDKVPETPLDEWIDYLKTGKIKENTRTPGLLEVREKLRVLSMTERERRAYYDHIDTIRFQDDVLETARTEGYVDGKIEGREEGRAEGREEGLKEGRAEGREEGIAEIARRMIANGMTDEMISSLTGLDADSIATLRE